MARKYKIMSSSGYTIVLADDDPDYLEATRLLLESEGHEVLCARNGDEALSLLRGTRAHLLLLDYFMPGMTGEEVVVALRTWNPLVQVILQTGYASEHPPREMLHRLDIQGYYDKSEGPDRLLLWTDAGLKAATTVLRLYQSRQGLRFILDVTPSMHKIQPIADLAGGLFTQLTSLLQAGDAFLAARLDGDPVRLSPATAEGCVAILQDDADLVVCTASGSFTVGRTLAESFAPQELAAVTTAIERGEPVFGPASTILPLRVGELTVGVIFARAAVVPSLDVELIEVFANQATVAIQNTQLYEMAALDPLTGVYARRFLDRWILREIRAAFRTRQPLSVLLLDLDDLKKINDTSGHLAGDQALMAMGRVLRHATRETDVVARYGGDEFLVILPQTAAEDAERVGQRILEVLEEKTLLSRAEGLSLRSSAGFSVLPAHTFSTDDMRQPFPRGYFQGMAQNLIRHADVALYRAKREARGRLSRGAATCWDPISA
jgi:diguanylate cyclase (GGDEF)-like protein